MNGITGLNGNFNAPKGYESLNSQQMNDHEKFIAQMKADEVNARVETKNKSMLGQEDFLTLLLKELEYQDPLEPMDNKEFIGQMAQFSTLQAETEASNHLENLNKLTVGNQAVHMLGREVKYIDPNNAMNPDGSAKIQSGRAESITYNENNQMSIIVNGQSINPMDVIQVNAVPDDK